MAFRSLSSFIPTADELLSFDLPRLGRILLLHLKSYEGLNTVFQNGRLNRDYFVAMLENRNVGLGPLPHREPEYRAKQSEVVRALTEAWNWLEREGLLIRDAEQPAAWFIISRRGEELLKNVERFEQWERLGLERVKNDLMTGGTRVIGGTLEVQDLAWQWVRMKEGQTTTSMDKAAATKSVHVDDLLGIPLRGSLDEDLGKLSAASEEEFFPLSVLMVDLDGFKLINDTYRHKTGDAVLKEVTSTIKAVCKGKAQLYRYGGDEFVVVLPNYNLREAEGIADRLREAVAQTPLPNCPLTVTASIGVASFRETCQEVNLLVEEADHAMYAAKDAGGNRVSLAKAPAEASAQSNVPARPTRSDITSRVEADELWMSLQQGYHPHFILLVENKSDDEINIESIALKRGKLFLCEPSKPKASDELVIPARSKRQISSWSPPVSPTYALQMKEPHVKDGQPIEIDIVVRGKVLGKLKTFSHTILATVDYLNQRITQFGG